MSIEVELSELADTVARYRFAYLLTVGDDGRSRALAVTPGIDGAALVVEAVGRRSRENLLAQPEVTLLWPPVSVDGYSLIVDGEASVREESVRVTPIRAVLHRPALKPDSPTPGGCESDCIELSLPARPDSS